MGEAAFAVGVDGGVCGGGRRAASCRRTSVRRPTLHGTGARSGKASSRATVRASAATSPVEATSSPPFTESITVPELVDVAVIGGGPAGVSIASAVATRGLSVMLVDNQLDKKWPNNYGVWLDEVAPLGLDDCMRKTWPKAAVYTSDAGERHVLDRPYGRVDVVKLKARLLQRFQRRGDGCGETHIFMGTASDVEHERDFSRFRLHRQRGSGGGEDSDAPQVRTRLLIDATGHAPRFVRFAGEHNPGFQTAYGIEAEVDSQPWARDEMLLMDFRASHMTADGASDDDRRDAELTPLFLYVMPLEGKRVFVEETSLIARPRLDFERLKRQLYRRLEHYGVRVERVFEEEFCLIPMGGGRPRLDQRVVGFGGTAGLVHPATGYMIANTLRRAEAVADRIALALRTHADGDEVSRMVWAEIWSTTSLRQRDFLEFGGEVLLRMRLSELRRFFGAFFRLPYAQWSEFLSFGLRAPPQRLWFGLGVFARTSNAVRLRLIVEAVRHGRWKLVRSVIPLPNALVMPSLSKQEREATAPHSAPSSPHSAPSSSSSADE